MSEEKIIEQLRNQNAELRDELDVKNREIRDLKEDFNKANNIAIKNMTDYIPKQKIRDKIDELSNGKDFDEDVYWEEHVIDVLQSLLEK